MNPDEINQKYSAMFGGVYRETRELKKKINEKNSYLFGIIKFHKYSQEELLKSPHHEKIKSLTGTIKHNVSSWQHAGNLSSKEEKAYNFQVRKTSSELESVNELIRNREPTFWESASKILIKFSALVIKELALEKTLLGSFKKVLKLPFLKKK